MADFVLIKETRLAQNSNVTIRFSYRVDRNAETNKEKTTLYLKRELINPTSQHIPVAINVFMKWFDPENPDKNITIEDYKTYKSDNGLALARYTTETIFQCSGVLDWGEEWIDYWGPPPEYFGFRVGFTEGTAVSQSGVPPYKVTQWPSSDVNSVNFTSIQFKIPPRLGSLTLPDEPPELGVPVTYKVNRQNPSLPYRLQANVNGETFYLHDSTYVYSEELTYTFPLEMANRLTTAEEYDLTLYLMMYDESNNYVGYMKYYDTLKIPASMIPAVSVTISDPSGYFDRYGGYVQGKSALRAAIAAEPSYSSEITVCDMQFGAQWTSVTPYDFTLLESGEKTLIGRAIDRRNRTGFKEVPITVIPYKAPSVDNTFSLRCMEDGTAQLDGSFVKIVYSASVSPVNNKNSAAYVLQFKEYGASEWTNIPFSQIVGNYNPKDISTVLSAEPLKRYQYKIAITDDFGTFYSNVYDVYPASALLEVDATGTGMAIGQMANEPGLFRVNLPSFFNHTVEASGALIAENHKIGISELWVDSDKSKGYVLYDNGLLIQWVNISTSYLSINKSKGSYMYYSDPVKWTFKRPFTTGNAVVIPSVNCDLENVWATLKYVTAEYAEITLLSNQSTATGTAFNIKAIAIGY